MSSEQVTAPLAKHQLQERIRQQSGAQLGDFLNSYAKQVRQWFREAVANLRTSFQSAATIYRAEIDAPEVESPQDNGQLAADLEELKRQVDRFSG
jgi:hypothetical protein